MQVINEGASQSHGRNSNGSPNHRDLAPTPGKRQPSLSIAASSSSMFSAAVWKELQALDLDSGLDLDFNDQQQQPQQQQQQHLTREQCHCNLNEQGPELPSKPANTLRPVRRLSRSQSNQSTISDITLPSELNRALDLSDHLQSSYCHHHYQMPVPVPMPDEETAPPFPSPSPFGRWSCPAAIPVQQQQQDTTTDVCLPKFAKPRMPVRQRTVTDQNQQQPPPPSPPRIAANAAIQEPISTETQDRHPRRLWGSPIQRPIITPLDKPVRQRTNEAFMWNEHEHEHDDYDIMDEDRTASTTPLTIIASPATSSSKKVPQPSSPCHECPPSMPQRRGSTALISS